METEIKVPIEVYTDKETPPIPYVTDNPNIRIVKQTLETPYESDNQQIEILNRWHFDKQD